MNDDDYVDYSSLEKPKWRLLDYFRRSNLRFSILFFLVHKEARKMKGYFLFHETEDIVKLEKKEIKDGQVTIGEKTFDIDKYKPKLFKTGLGYFPFYMLKWDSMNPPEEFNPVFKEDKNVTPEIYHKTMKMKILGNMLKIKKEGANTWILIAVGAAFGIFIAYYLISMKILPLF
jgi:hypothetical protein